MFEGGGGVGGREPIQWTHEKIQVVSMQMAFQLEEIIQAINGLSKMQMSLPTRDRHDKQLWIEEMLDLWLRQVSSLSEGGRESRINSKVARAAQLDTDASYMEWRSYLLQFIQIGIESLDEMMLLLTDVRADPNLGARFIDDLREWTYAESRAEEDAEEE
jgi:hypothetical protein